MANNLLSAATTLFLFILSISVSVAPTLATADTDSDLVLDTDGNPLEVGSQYYIQPGPISVRGGIGRSARPGTKCPLYAIEYASEVNRGDPVKFESVDKTQKQIHLSSDVKIDSGFSAHCRDDGLWRLSRDPINRRVAVIASGAPNVPRTTFKIEKTNGLLPVYKITTSSEEPLGQGYLTLFPDFPSGMTMVGLTDDPTEALRVLFFKYKGDVVATI